MRPWASSSAPALGQKAELGAGDPPRVPERRGWVREGGAGAGRGPGRKGRGRNGVWRALQVSRVVGSLWVRNVSCFLELLCKPRKDGEEIYSPGKNRWTRQMGFYPVYSFLQVWSLKLKLGPGRQYQGVKQAGGSE